MDQTQIQRYVSRFEPLAQHPRLHREGFLIHYTPTEEDLLQHKEYRTPLSNTASQPRGRPVAKQQQTNTSTEEGLQTKLHLSQEGANQQSQPLPKREQTNHPINPTKEGYNKSKGVYNKWLQRPQTLFLFH